MDARLQRIKELMNSVSSERDLLIEENESLNKKLAEKEAIIAGLEKKNKELLENMNKIHRIITLENFDASFKADTTSPTRIVTKYYHGGNCWAQRMAPKCYNNGECENCSILNKK